MYFLMPIPIFIHCWYDRKIYTTVGKSTSRITNSCDSTTKSPVLVTVGTVGNCW